MRYPEQLKTICFDIVVVDLLHLHPVIRKCIFGYVCLRKTDQPAQLLNSFNLCLICDTQMPYIDRDGSDHSAGVQADISGCCPPSPYGTYSQVVGHVFVLLSNASETRYLTFFQIPNLFPILFSYKNTRYTGKKRKHRQIKNIRKIGQYPDTSTDNFDNERDKSITLRNQ